MDVDLARAGWSQRACGRWVVYSLAWVATAATALFAAQHAAVRVAGMLLGCLLAAALPLSFATLFEAAYSRRARQDLPVICCPLLGALVVLLGVAAMQQASPIVVWQLSSPYLDSAKALAELPSAEASSVCLRKAFVKTDWESGKLVCRDEEGHVSCGPQFVAAPIFDDKAASDRGLGLEVRAWAVTHGPHVTAAYQPDGSLCGYLHGVSDLDFHLGSYQTAIGRIVSNHELGLAAPAAAGNEEAATKALAASGEARPGLTPLARRPMLLVVDPSAMASEERRWMILALMLLAACPCVGPLPLGVVFCYWGWARREKISGAGGCLGEEDRGHAADGTYGLLPRA